MTAFVVKPSRLYSLVNSRNWDVYVCRPRGGIIRITMVSSSWVGRSSSWPYESGSGGTGRGAGGPAVIGGAAAHGGRYVEAWGQEIESAAGMARGYILGMVCIYNIGRGSGMR